MARKPQKIQTVAYVHVGNQLVDVDTLNHEQRDYLGASLQVATLNAAYRGKAEFWVDLPPVEQVFPHSNRDQTESCKEGCPCGQS